MRAARSLRMGDARRIAMLFVERFWTNSSARLPLDDLGFLFAPGALPPTWWTQFPSRSGHLTAWVGGPRSEQLAGLQLSELRKTVCGTLARIFQARREEIDNLLTECHSHDWREDPFYCGTYSYVPAGAIEAPNQMSEPVDGTLYFAGEHTDTTGHWGTVHAAVRSGLRAARQILEG